MSFVDATVMIAATRSPKKLNILHMCVILVAKAVVPGIEVPRHRLRVF